MRKCLLPSLLAIILFTLPEFVFSQAKLSGKISDSTKPVAYATVRLLKKNSPTPLRTTLSKDDGSFEFRKPDTGNYVLSFTHTGFSEKRVAIRIDSRDGDMQIEPIQLSKITGMLKEVVVNAPRPMVEQSDDKTVFNVEDDPTNKTETALDILRKTPFITVDGEDNIKVNGKDNFKVLLNGRETSMFARNVKDALRAFPGALISKIEVITTPSAKYDGEGVGGLINIITKKKVAGYNGTLTTFSRTSDKLNAFGINGNGKFGKLGVSLFFNKGATDAVLLPNVNTTIPTLPTVYSKRTLAGNQYSTSGWSFGNAELSWEVDSLNTISLYSNIDSYNNETVSDQTITTDFTSSPSTLSRYHLDNNGKNPGVSIGSDYIKHFKSNKDREFSIRFLGEFGKNDADINSDQDYPERYLLNNSKANNNQYTIQVDNSIPLHKNGRLEGGVKAILRRASSDFRSLVKYDPNAEYSVNESNTDYFKYAQDVYGVYSMYTLRVKKSSFRIGARAEFTHVNGNFVSTNTQVKNDYVTLLPNIQFTNRLTPSTTLVLTYTKRLQRPYIYDLNPFVNNNDSLNITFGNPNLGPQIVHALTAQVRYSKGNFFGGINWEGSYSDNKILQYSSFDPQTGITKTTSLNIGKEFQSSVTVNFSVKLTPRWSVFMNSSLRYSTVTNNSDPTQSNSGFGCNFNLNTSYRFTDKFSVSSYLGLWQDPQTIQSTYPFNTWHNIAFNYKILKGKVNISLRTVNYTEKTHDFKTITKDKNFYNTNVSTQVRRGAVLSLTWNFGKLNENVSKKKGVSNDDLLNKPAGAPVGN